MTSMAIVAATLPMMDTVPIVAIFVLIVDLVLAVQLRASLANPSVRAALKWLCAGSIAGVPLGVRLLMVTDPRLLFILLGLCMLAFVAERLLHEAQRFAAPAPACPTDHGERLIPAGTTLSDGVRMPEKIADRISRSLSSPPSPLVLSTPVAVQPQLSNLGGNGGGGDGGTTGGNGGGGDDGTTGVNGGGGDGGTIGVNGGGGDAVGVCQRVRSALLRIAVGVASGLLNGALNEGGPPVIIFVTLQGWGKDDAKATLQFFFLFVQVLTIAQLVAHGVLQPYHLYYDAVGLPAAALGIGVGVAVYNRLDVVLFTRIVVAAMLVTGVGFISSSVIDLQAHPLPAS